MVITQIRVGMSSSSGPSVLLSYAYTRKTVQTFEKWTMLAKDQGGSKNLKLREELKHMHSHSMKLRKVWAARSSHNQRSDSILVDDPNGHQEPLSYKLERELLESLFGQRRRLY